MKVSLNWAREYTEIDLPTEELVQLATERLGGIESVEDISKHYDGIVVARIVTVLPHSNADNLRICKIDDGGAVEDVARDENGMVQVVCAAPNLYEGMLVAWIPPRAIVPASYGDKELFVLEARELRGEISNGMLASARELSINDDHDGILEIESEDALASSDNINKEIIPGTPFKDLYNLDDLVIEIENKMFTHRPDGFGQLGVARELSGIQHQAFTSPDWYLNTEVAAGVPTQPTAVVTVKNEVPELCPRFMAIVLDNVKIAPSPIWLQSYLKRVGIRPINNVVDITNYVMVLTAKPMHAFDFDKIAKDNRADITIRKPRDGETMTLLGDKKITPHKDAVLICSADEPISLGGVMGGNNSEIDENTTRVVIENATFDMYNIRKTSMVHGIFSDALTRFNKGQPPAQLVPAMNKTLEMMAQLAGATVASELVDDYSVIVKNQPVLVSADFINRRLGSELSAEAISAMLKNVEFTVERTEGTLTVTAPFWRTDIEIKEDIVEEVGRMYGFNQLPSALPMRDITPVTPDKQRKLKQSIREILSSAGANEVLTYSFVHGDLLRKTGQKPEDSYKLRNALSPDLQYYRQSLTPSLLENVNANIKAGYDQFALFEVGKAHNKIHGNAKDGLPGELNMVTLTFAAQQSGPAGYFSARRYLDFLANKLGLTLRYDVIAEDPGFPVTASFDHMRSALVTINEGEIFLGIVGEYKASVSKQLKLPEISAGFEIGLDALQKATDDNSDTSYHPLSRYPSTHQDMTFKTVKTILFSQLDAEIRTQLKRINLWWELTPLGIFQPEGVDTKNTSFRLTLSNFDRTLTTNEVNQLVEKISWHLNQTLQAEQI